MWIRVVEPADATGELSDVYERVAGARGKLSNIMLAQSLDPAAMRAHLDLYMALLFSRSGLSRPEREAIAVAVSAANGCEYCVSHHAPALQAYWKDEARVRRLAEDHQAVEVPPRLRAMLDYAVLLTREPAAVAESHVAAMRAEGLSDEEILGVNLITGYFNFVNRVAEGLGVEFTAEEAAGYRY
ncbi:MAG TPA: peroxidase-related enzyme [Longimicrobiaceae bacterium]|nr:peroxidase-related enzyme [Longimicrobiaceae bacterium]